MGIEGKKIGILIESDFYEKEIFYYEHRFAEEGLDVHWLTRLWGQPSLTFIGHEYQVPFECHESFEGMSDEELRSYDAIIVPSAIVSDRLRYSENLPNPAPAVEFLKRAFAEPDIIKGIICHGMWLVSPGAGAGARTARHRPPESVRRRGQHGRHLHRPGRRRRRRPGDRAHGRPLPSVRPQDHRHAP